MATPLAARRGRRGGRGLAGLAGLDDAWCTRARRCESDIVGFDVVDDHTTTAVVDVRVESDATDVQCLVRAYATDKVVVGERVFTPTGDGRTEVSVRTERLATAVENVGCTADGQLRPR